ncbi:hypothetical protein O9G_001192 [Rozella allomycis CSF55]|uniref:Protein kinase domain-containing protein n=1 Tax=Rozella allomycis (strain CSF55) TaxID=988480 RepID=A0A075ASI7_ROZAC|nr:hypothetical protein O9G_001192 [Rozella allomycis CSF55]|eukprot:EPZ33223.1 hypothetical protein O9G_001192 [Rozella allomycis CSF55]
MPVYKSIKLLNSIELPRVVPEVSHTSTNTTNPVCPREPEKLLLWESFEQEVSEALRTYFTKESFCNKMEKEKFIEDDDLLCSCEADVEAYLLTNIYRPVQSCLKNMGIKSSIRKPGGEAHLIGAVDALWMTGEGTEVYRKPKGTIQVKTPWAMGEVGDIIATYQRESQLKEYHHKKIFKAVNQVYGYMSVNSHKYGVLTNFNCTWFFERGFTDKEGGCLRVSRPFYHDTILPGLCGDIGIKFNIISAFLGIVLLSHHNWFHVSPFTTPNSTPKVHRKLKNKNYGVKILKQNEFWLNECIANGRIGSVVRGNLWGHENVIFKLKDLTKESWKEKELKNEVSVYKKLESLQGKVIPKFIACVKIWDMFTGIVISDCGQQTEEGEFVSLKQDCLRQFHDQGLIHGDVCNRNFVKNIEGKVFIIDFGFTRPCNDENIKSEELESCKY